MQIIGSRGVGVGQFNKPRSVAVDAQDNLYVVDMTGRVQKFSPNGVFLLSWQMPQTDLGKPKGMGRDRDGNIVVIEPHYQRVNHFSPDGQAGRAMGRARHQRGEFSLAARGGGEFPRRSLRERIRPGRARAAVLPRAASQLARLPSASPATAPGEFNRPEGLCVDAQDRLYVADSCNHRIQVFSTRRQVPPRLRQGRARARAN